MVALLIPFSPRAEASWWSWLTLQGSNGTSYVVTSPIPWRVSFSSLSAGYRDGGVAGLDLELLGRPPDKGISAVALLVPSEPGSDAYHRSVRWRGALDYDTGISDVLPAGRYLVTLVGQGTVTARVATTAGGKLVITRTRSRVPLVREVAATSSLSPALAPYATTTSVPLRLPSDPLVFTYTTLHIGTGQQTWEAAACVEQPERGCQTPLAFGSALSPTHQTERTRAGITDDFYDARFGLRGGQLWHSEVVLRATQPGATIFTVAVVFSGGNG